MAESFVEVSAGTGTKLHSNTRTIGANTVHDEVAVIGEPYLASYTVAPLADISTATSASHIIQIMAGAALKVRIRRILVYQTTVATTAAFAGFSLWRLSTAGTGGTVYTPRPLDTADAASGATAMTLPTAKGTESVTIAYVNVALTQTVTATPSAITPLLDINFDQTRFGPLIIAAGTSNGIALKNQAAYAGATLGVNVWFTETNF